MEKYNTETCLHIKLTNEGLDALNHFYHVIHAPPQFITDFIQMQPSMHRETVSIKPSLYKFSDDGRFLLMPNPVYTSYEQLMTNPTHARKNEAGFSLVGWFIHPVELSKTEYRHKKTRDTHAIQEEKCNQKNEPNSKNSALALPHLISILDLTKNDLPFLEEMEKIAYNNLIENYGICDDDVIRMYFHFPYADIKTSLHLHVTINQGMHDLEKTKSFTLSEVIQSINMYNSVRPLILCRETIQASNTPNNINFLSGIDGLTVYIDNNPHIQACAIEVFND